MVCENLTWHRIALIHATYTTAGFNVVVEGSTMNVVGHSINIKTEDMDMNVGFPSTKGNEEIVEMSHEEWAATSMSIHPNEESCK